MLQAIANASQGDSVYGEDENTIAFEQRVAKLAGKEKGLFMVSGTLSNQVGVRVALTQPPYSILCDYRAHIYTCEAAGLAVLSQAIVTPVRPANKVYLTLEDVQAQAILSDDIHVAPTKLIALENTLGGTIIPIEEIKRISEFARKNGIRMHLDGARLWNASAATGVSISEYAQYFDTVSLCFSKGLGAPVGSVLVGDAESIKRAEWIRKQQGGGIRQAGLLTSAANVALDEVWPTMKETHALVAYVASELEKLGMTFQLPVQTNFIFLDSIKAGMNLEVFAEQAEKFDIKVRGERLVFHHQISKTAAENLIKCIATSLELSKKMPKENTGSSWPYSRRMDK